MCSSDLPTHTVNSGLLVQDTSHTLTNFNSTPESIDSANSTGFEWFGDFVTLVGLAPCITWRMTENNINNGMFLVFRIRVLSALLSTQFSLNWTGDYGTNTPSMVIKWQWTTDGGSTWIGGAGNVLGQSTIALGATSWSNVLVHLTPTDLRIFEDGAPTLAVTSRPAPPTGAITSIKLALNSPYSNHTDLATVRTCPYQFRQDLSALPSLSPTDLILNSTNETYNETYLLIPTDAGMSINYTASSLRFHTPSLTT